MSKHEVTMYGEPYCTEEDFDKVLAERDKLRETAMAHTEFVLASINRELTAERDRLRGALLKAVEWMRESSLGDEYIADNWYRDALDALKEAEG